MRSRILNVFALAFCILTLAPAAGWARSSSSSNDIPNDRFIPRLVAFAQKEAQERDNKLPGQFAYLSEIVTDRELDMMADNVRKPVFFRDQIVQKVMDVLMRERGKFPILIGEPGVGKTAVISEFAADVALGNYPKTDAFDQMFGPAVVTRTSMRNFVPGSSFNLSTYLATARVIQNNLGKRLILVFNECHFLNDYNISILREEADRPDGLGIVFETDSKSYGNTMRGHPSFLSLAETILVPSLKPDQVLELLKSRREALTQTYKVEISDQVLTSLIDVAPDFRQDMAEPHRSLTLLEDFMIAQNRASNGQDVSPQTVDLYRFIAEQVRLPVIPQNEAEFAAYMGKVKEEIKSELVGQDINIDGIIDQFVAALTSRTRKHTVALLLGPTGVGKTLIGEKLAEKFYGDKSRFLELDMTQFKDQHALSSLFGASNGYLSSDKEKGALCDFFDGPGRGGGILVLNEIEEMSSQALTRFMEIFDKGEFRGGDGKVRYLGRTMVLLTSNKNSDRILSYDAIRGIMRGELQRRLSLITQDQLKKAFTEKVSYTEDDSKVVKSAVLERVDKLYFFSPLLREDAIRVAQLETKKYVRDYERQGSTKLNVDPSFQDVLTSAFYNEALGSRQLRTSVQQLLTKMTQEFKAKYGYDVKEIGISAALHPALKTVSFLTASDPAGHTMTIDGPKVPVTNKLLDSEFRGRLANLDQCIKGEIFGQDESIDAIVSSIKGHYLRGASSEAIAGFLIGVTGSGKSQIAKTLARCLYGRTDAAGLFEMGRIQHQSDLATILSPGKGIIGSDQPGELEKFLIQFPDGGVLLFDEMSNAGGPDRQLKESIAKQFYTMMQEGYYKSPSGKVYDLSKYVMIFTGNDGEEVFKGLQSDSLRDEAHKDATKKPGMVKELLSKAGFSDAFIGRLAFVSLMRPTLGPDKIRIAKKMIEEWKRDVEKSQPFEIVYDNQFVEEVGHLMFSPKTGARSIKEFISQVLGALVGNEALKVDWPSLMETGDRVKMNVSIAAVKPLRPFYTGDEPDKTEAMLHVTMTRNGEELGTAKLEFTDKATFQPQVHESIAEATAGHEMGHGLNTFKFVTGKKVVKITIIPENIGGNLSALGYAQYRSIPRKSHADRDYLVKSLAGLLAGSEAESMLGSSWNAGRSNDVERVGETARRLVLEGHMEPEFDAAHAFIDKDGKIIGNMPADLQQKFADYVDKAIKDARELARENTKENWPALVAGVKFLMKYGSMNEKEFENLERMMDAVRPRMQALMQAGWTREAAEQVVIDFEAIRNNAKGECHSALAAGA